MGCPSQLPAVSGGHAGLLSWSNEACDGKGAVSEGFRVSLVCQPQTLGSPISKRRRRIRLVCDAKHTPAFSTVRGIRLRVDTEL